MQGNDFIIDHVRQALISLAATLKKMKSSTLRLIDNNFKPGEMEFILKKLKDNSIIETFELTNVKYSDALADFIAENRSIEDFTLSLVNSDDTSETKIMAALDKNYSLIRVDMPFMSPYKKLQIQSNIGRNLLIMHIPSDIVAMETTE